MCLPVSSGASGSSFSIAAVRVILFAAAISRASQPNRSFPSSNQRLFHLSPLRRPRPYRYAPLFLSKVEASSLRKPFKGWRKGAGTSKASIIGSLKRSRKTATNSLWDVAYRHAPAVALPTYDLQWPADSTSSTCYGTSRERQTLGGRGGATDTATAVQPIQIRFRSFVTLGY